MCPLCKPWLEVGAPCRSMSTPSCVRSKAQQAVQAGPGIMRKALGSMLQYLRLPIGATRACCCISSTAAGREPLPRVFPARPGLLAACPRCFVLANASAYHHKDVGMQAGPSSCAPAVAAAGCVPIRWQAPFVADPLHCRSRPIVQLAHCLHRQQPHLCFGWHVRASSR